jgi:hypothetical protein
VEAGTSHDGLAFRKEGPAAGEEAADCDAEEDRTHGSNEEEADTCRHDDQDTRPSFPSL